MLPENEQPTLATVVDKNKLKDNFLKTRSENGDKILIYAQNRMVIIYRPSIDKIAAVGNVSADLANLESKSTTLTIFNGSDNKDKVNAIIAKLKNKYPELQIIDGGKTNRQDYPTTIVVDNTNKKDYLLVEISDLLGANRGVIPRGVEKVETDLMIIVGKD